MKARLCMHWGGNTPSQPNQGGWMPRGQLTNPNAMDTSARRTRGRIAGSEEMDPHTMPQGGYVPRGGYMPQGGFLQGRGQGLGCPRRNLNEVECYTCHQKGHFSCNCLQHTWNKNQSQGRDAVVDDHSIDEEQIIMVQSSMQTPQQSANAWLHGVANKHEEVRDLVMRDLLRQEDFQGA